MKNKSFRTILIIIVVILAILIDLPVLESAKQKLFKRDLTPQLGLDLRGGMQVVLQASEGSAVDAEKMDVALSILENRANALGVSEVVFQMAGDNYIVGEFPGLENIDEVISVIKQTGMLEFVDVGQDYLEPGTVIQTDYNDTAVADTGEAAETTAEERMPLLLKANRRGTETTDMLQGLSHGYYGVTW